MLIDFMLILDTKSPADDNLTMFEQRRRVVDFNSIVEVVFF
jgi:hypothetical protein